MSKPLFQKRHYEVIAEVIRTNTFTIGDIRAMAEPMIELFRKDNPNFNESKFWRAINEGTTR